MKRKITAIFLVVALALSLGLVPAALVGADPGPGIVGLWHFDEGNGTTTSDSSGNGNTGTLMGNAAWAGSGTGSPASPGDALSFDGTNAYVEVAHDTALNPTSAITVECWAELDVVSQDQVLVRKMNTYSLQVSVGWDAPSAPKLEGWVMIGGTWRGVRGVSGATALVSGQWYHFAFTYDGTNVITYVNGVVDRSNAVSGAIDPTSNPVNIGRCGPPEPVHGYTDGTIDEVRIWDEALPQARLGDITAPVVTINDPDNGAYYQTADVPTADFTVVDANSYTVVEAGYSTDEGVQTYTVTATDVLGYVGSDSVTYTVDNTAPVVTINAPADGAFYTIYNVPALDYTVTDNLDPSPTVVVTGYYTVAGVHTVTVTATDAAGNLGSASVTYYVLENFVTGGGNIQDGKKPAWTFAGTVGNLENGSVGQFQIVDHTGKKAVAWHCNNDFSSLVFSGSAIDGPPGPDATHSIATFMGTFTNNRNSDEVEITVEITDVDEPGKGWGTIFISSTGPDVFSQTIDGGNFQVHDLPDDNLF